MLTLAKCYNSSITLEQNEISSPNSAHICASSIFGQIKKKCAALLLGGAIRFKKHKNSYNYANVSPIDLKIVMQCLCPICHKCI